MSNGTPSSPAGPGGEHASGWHIAFIAVTLIAMIVLLLGFLVQIWPHPTPSTAPVSPRDSTTVSRPADDTLRGRSPATPSPGDTTGDTVRLAAGDTARVDTGAGANTERAAGSIRRGTAGAGSSPCAERKRGSWTDSTRAAPAECVRIFGWEVLLWDETRLLLLVLVAGALGGLLHALRSLGWYVGNRELVKSWIPRYFFLAFTGALLSFAFYVVVRGGFFSPNTTMESTSPFGFMAFGMLVGLFSEQAILKLKQVAETLLAKPSPGEDSKPQGTGTPPPPRIDSITRDSDAQGNPTSTFTLKGSGLTQATEVWIGGARQSSSFASESELKLTLPQVPPPGARLTVEVRNPGGGTATRDHTL